MSKLSIALFLVVILFGPVPLFGEIIFNKADSIHHTIATAKNQKKLLLTFAADSSAPSCIAMQKKTFKDPETEQIISDFFYPVKLDFSRSLDQTWATRYEIFTTPSILFFDQSGTLIQRIETALTSSEFKDLLQDVLFYNAHGFWPIESENQVVLSTYIPPADDDYTNHIDTTATTTKTPGDFPSKPNGATTFSIAVDRITTRSTDAKEIIEQIKLDLPEHQVRIKLNKENGEAFYEILVGNFVKNSDAQDWLNKVKKRGFEKAKIISQQPASDP